MVNINMMILNEIYLYSNLEKKSYFKNSGQTILRLLSPFFADNTLQRRLDWVENIG